ncbi:MAG: hypothetical protein HOV68_32740 [Streptomycetaceae bacterium]|nr:hypothetical protein [Streptomycetaceae bacterium]
MALALMLTLTAGRCAQKARKAAVGIAAEAVGQLVGDAFLAMITGTDRSGVPRGSDGGPHRGDEPGLYGVIRGASACDKITLQTLLTDPQQAEKSREWAAVVGIPAGRVEAYIGSLTPVVLRNDTLVTNHGYKDGRSFGYESVLQAGTAVLVDGSGALTVKCSFGSPLTPPKHDVDEIDPQITDAGWAADYDADAVQVVRPGSADVDRFVLTDLDTGDGVTRPSGSTGEDDAAVTASDGEPAPTPTKTKTKTTKTSTKSGTDESTAKPKSPTAQPTTQPNGDRTRTGTGTATATRPRSPSPAPPASAPARLSVAPEAMPPGTPYTLRASGFAPGEWVQFWQLNPMPMLLGSALADEAGAVSAPAMQHLYPGDYTIQANGQLSRRSASAHMLITY